MTKRTKTGQKKHDTVVLKSAQWYQTHGFNVKADLPNFEKPKTIQGFIPDIIAKKGTKEIVKEIETKDSNKKDLKQQQAFKNYTNKGKGRKFIKKVI